MLGLNFGLDRLIIDAYCIIRKVTKLYSRFLIFKQLFFHLSQGDETVQDFLALQSYF